MPSWKLAPLPRIKHEKRTAGSAWETWTVSAADGVRCARVRWEINTLLPFETAPFFCKHPVFGVVITFYHNGDTTSLVHFPVSPRLTPEGAIGRTVQIAFAATQLKFSPLIFFCRFCLFLKSRPVSHNFMHIQPGFIRYFRHLSARILSRVNLVVVVSAPIFTHYLWRGCPRYENFERLN